MSVYQGTSEYSNYSKDELRDIWLCRFSDLQNSVGDTVRLQNKFSKPSSRFLRKHRKAAWSTIVCIKEYVRSLDAECDEIRALIDNGY
jgi:hypothetical protein